jgi:hypothetical protein
MLTVCEGPGLNFSPLTEMRVENEKFTNSGKLTLKLCGLLELLNSYILHVIFPRLQLGVYNVAYYYYKFCQISAIYIIFFFTSTCSFT